MGNDANKWSTFKKVAPKSDAPSDNRYFDNFVVLHNMEHLLEKYFKKWSNFDEMAPKSGAPIRKRGFRGLCTLNRCTKGACGHKVRIWRRTGEWQEE